jgi:predicted metalloprotease with PDZ domain
MRTVLFKHTPLIGARTLISCLACCVNVLTAPAAMAQDGQLAIEYTVKVADIPGQLFHVSTDIKNINQPALELSLPTWTPGWYTIENYAKNIFRFRVTEPGGRRLQAMQVRKQTWRVETTGITRIKVEFEYLATSLALNQARIAPDYAFFTGTQLFLLPEGHRSSPSAVRFDVPTGWKVVSALEDTADPMVFRAPDYDTLVDQPTQMGHFDVTRFMVEGKPHDFVANPAGVFSAEKTRTFIEHLTKLAQTEGKIFGGLPYRKFVHFYFFRRAETTASGALEHQDSYVAFVNAGAQAQPDDMVGQAAHEFFHLWNVKRIRPVQMWPYDYARENETPLLWMSEGFTIYYGSVASYRAGLTDAQSFVDGVARTLSAVENNEARHYMSVSDASTSTWIGYDSPVPFGVSYYTQGRNLAALVDLSIRHDTRGASGLDDVMRTLFTDFYQRGRGFSTEDLIDVINRITGNSYGSFFSRYVTGIEIPPYETIFGYAGYQLERATRRSFDLGVSFDQSGSISRVHPGSSAGAAGLSVGDFLLSIDGQALDRQSGPAVFRSLNEKVGQNLTLRIRRDGDERELGMKLDSREEVTYRIVDGGSPTLEQLKIRESWLRR